MTLKYKEGTKTIHDEESGQPVARQAAEDQTEKMQAMVAAYNVTEGLTPAEIILLQRITLDALRTTAAGLRYRLHLDSNDLEALQEKLERSSHRVDDHDERP
jgi:hypothetical protein